MEVEGSGEGDRTGVGSAVGATNDWCENIRPIDLPQAFRDVKFAKRLAIDIGGSLAKVAYLSSFARKRPKHQSFSSDKNTDSDSVSSNDLSPLYEFREEEGSGERLHFVKFETKYLETCLDFIQQNLHLASEDGSAEKPSSLKVTGGGAYKYKDEITRKLNIRVDKEDEMQCLIRGCNFMLHNIPNEVFEFRRDQSSQYVFKNLLDTEIFPYLLVNIGSGVSIIRVDSFDSFVRVGGTSMGGGTFWGLGSLLTSAKGFDELLDLASGGQHTNVDMLVQDIYGGNYSLIGLPGDLTACSFGKAVRSALSQNQPNLPKSNAFTEKDIAKSLLHMISNDIGQLASLHAKLNGLKRITFGGFFIRGHPITMHTITYAINYWSKGEQKALFLRHEGYLGAIGAFIQGAEEEAAMNKSSFLWNWGENYAGSSGLPTNNKPQPQVRCDVLALDRMERSLVPFPLLYKPSKYHPDTEDLTADQQAREYWLDCFEGALHQFVAQAIESQPNLPDAEERALKFKEKYLQRLKVLRHKSFAKVLGLRISKDLKWNAHISDIAKKVSTRLYFLCQLKRARIQPSDLLTFYKTCVRPVMEYACPVFQDSLPIYLSEELEKLQSAYGSLTVRSLLDTREQFLTEFQFSDPYAMVKQKENETALLNLSKRLQQLDKLSWYQKQVEVAEGVLAGNVFDWGAKEVVKLMRKGQLEFETARSNLQARPWLNDDLDAWIERLKGNPHRMAVVFVDNSGADIVLGIFPFVRELLSRGTVVVLAANSLPALNDVTFSELQIIADKVAAICPVVNHALSENRLVVMESGTFSPCLDLRRVDAELVQKCLNADLVILEGMGRAIHTNYDARFTCESLKMAVIKNKWLAQRLHGEMYSVIFRYHPGEAPLN